MPLSCHQLILTFVYVIVPVLSPEQFVDVSKTNVGKKKTIISLHDLLIALRSL